MKRLITHNGVFHADEIMATAILLKLFPSAEIVRTRDKTIIESADTNADIVYDVGFGKYDHHQSDKLYRNNGGIPYSSIGLIWRDFGRDVIKKMSSIDIKHNDIETIFNNIDIKLIRGIDAVDNGINVMGDIEVLNVSKIISAFNPPWDEIESENFCFNEAVSFAKIIFDKIMNFELSIIRMKNIIEKAFEDRNPELKSVLLLPQPGPWQEALLELDKKEEVLFVVFRNNQGWMIQAVPKKIGSFESRKLLPEKWVKEGLPVDDGIFCHQGRFIAGAKSMESIWKLVFEAIK